MGLAPPHHKVTVSELAIAVASFQEFPGDGKIAQELAGPPRSCQEHPGAPRNKQELPEAPKRGLGCFRVF